MDETKLQKRLKNFTFFLIGISLFIFVFSGFASLSLRDMFKTMIYDHIKIQTIEYKLDIKRKMDIEIKMLDIISELLQANENATSKNVSEIMDKINTENNFERITYFNTKGEGKKLKTDGKLEEKVNISNINEYAREAIKRAWNGETEISDVYYDKTINDEVIAYAVPVRINGKIEGVLAACERISNISEFIEDCETISDEGIIALVNSSGTILAGTEKTKAENIKYIYGFKSLANDTKNELVNSLEYDSNSILFFNDVNGREFYAISEPIGIRDWSIVIVDSTRGVSGAIDSNMRLTRIINIIPMILSIVCIIYGYKQVRKSNDELLKLAYHDSLTGAYNTQKFDVMLHNKLEASREGAVIAINIRQFKFINELFGLEQANRLLRYIKEFLDDCLQRGEFFCRAGADSFYIFMNGSNPENIQKRLEKLINKINGTMTNKHKKYPIMFYAGVAFTNDIENEDDKTTQVMTRVMLALNYAKGKAESISIKFYDLEIHKNEQLHNYIEMHMQQALENGEFKLFLQPKINLKTGEVYGAEALVRWITNEKQMIFPDQFIPLFEQNGFCKKLDLYMFESVCRQLREWTDRGCKPITISVNQSKLLFYEDYYVEMLCSLVEKYDIPANWITLEILEGLALTNVEQINMRILQLKKHGFKISMDDFGSGYSSLNTLGNLDIDELKLDRGFQLAASKKGGYRQKIIMEQIIVLAKKMNISIVAEGVETEQNEKMIIDLGCDFGQGYYYSRPISAYDFGKLYMIEENFDEEQI